MIEERQQIHRFFALTWLIFAGPVTYTVCMCTYSDGTNTVKSRGSHTSSESHIKCKLVYMFDNEPCHGD